jgi:hypothetical protein
VTPDEAGRDASEVPTVLRAAGCVAVNERALLSDPHPTLIETSKESAASASGRFGHRPRMLGSPGRRLADAAVPIGA